MGFSLLRLVVELSSYTIQVVELFSGITQHKETTMAAKYALLKSSNDKFHFNLKAGNGEVILSSQMYEAKASAEDGIASVKANSADDGNFERKTAKDDSPYFVLKAGNGQIIGNSEMYSSTSAMENGIESVKKNGPVAEVDDQTG